MMKADKQTGNRQTSFKQTRPVPLTLACLLTRNNAKKANAHVACLLVDLSL